VEIPGKLRETNKHKKQIFDFGGEGSTTRIRGEHEVHHNSKSEPDSPSCMQCWQQVAELGRNWSALARIGGVTATSSQAIYLQLYTKSPSPKCPCSANFCIRAATPLAGQQLRRNRTTLALKNNTCSQKTTTLLAKKSPESPPFCSFHERSPPA